MVVNKTALYYSIENSIDTKDFSSPGLENFNCFKSNMRHSDFSPLFVCLLKGHPLNSEIGSPNIGKLIGLLWFSF